jgi:hypothetical protein
MLNGHKVVAEDHLWYRNTDLVGHGVDGIALADGELARLDVPAFDGVVYSSFVRGLRGGVGVVDWAVDGGHVGWDFVNRY